MATRTHYNMNSSAVKRIMQEARELANDPSTDYSAAPLEDDIFEWHCTIRGTPGSEFEGGLYHFRILLPTEYPFRPPSIMMLTPNGRFELNTKICISFTNYHEELWQPAWGVRTAIIGLQGFFPLKGTAAVGVGALEYPVAERKRLAALSRDWVCPTCNKPNVECLPDPPDTQSSPVTADESGSSSSAPQPRPSTPHAHTTEAEPERVQPAPVDGLADRTLNILDAATATTIADPPPPANVLPTPILHAPKPVRPIDAASIVIPASPRPPPSPLPAAPLPSEQIRSRHRLDEHEQESRTHTPHAPHLQHVVSRSPPRPPILLDTAICVLLVLVFGLLCRRIL